MTRSHAYRLGHRCIIAYLPEHDEPLTLPRWGARRHRQMPAQEPQLEPVNRWMPNLRMNGVRVQEELT